MSKFKEAWLSKAGDEDNLAENLSNYHNNVDKETVHVTYDENGTVVNSHQDRDAEEEELMLQEAENLGKKNKKTFKSEWEKNFGTAFAGDVPESLLAAQDLLGEQKDDDAERDETEKLPDNSAYKSNVASDDKLSVLADKAEDADTKNEKDTLSDRIKQVQINRQKAALKYRGVNKHYA